MTTIIIRDMARRALERASEGRQTILYTQGGSPSVMNVVPKFLASDIKPEWPSNVFPAFQVGSITANELFIGSFHSSLSGNEVVSAPLAKPINNISQDDAINLARVNGIGWHALTAIEWSALALWSWRNGFVPRGNNYYGQSYENPAESGARIDGAAPGVTTIGNGETLAGSGPAGWRHDNTMFGVADLNGNYYDFCTGLRVVSGEIQIITFNYGAYNTTDFSATSSAWKAIDATSGANLTPQFTGSIAGGDYVATTENSVRFSATPANGCITIATTLAGLKTQGIGDDALRVLTYFGLLAPAADSLVGADAFNVTLSGERILLKGGRSIGMTASGLFATAMSNTRSTLATTNSFRLAYAAI